MAQQSALNWALLCCVIRKAIQKKGQKESMIKSITIGDKAYQMETNLGIYDTYKSIFGSELGKDIKTTSELLNEAVDESKTENFDVSKIISVINTCTNIAWVMIKSCNPTFKPLTEWKKELDDGMIGSWCGEVLAHAYYPFRVKAIPQDHKPPQQ